MPIINAIIFLYQNKNELYEFLNNLSEKNDHLFEILHVLKDNYFNIELDIIFQIIHPMKTNLEISQIDDILELSKKFSLIDNFMKTLKYLIVKENTELFINDTLDRYDLNDQDYYYREKLIKNIIIMSEGAIEKYKKHVVVTEIALKAIHIFSNLPSKKNFPTGINAFSNLGFFSNINEWNNARELKIEENVDPITFWENQKDNFKALSDLVLRLYSIKSGICNLERRFSIWKFYQNKQKLNLKEENLEKILIIRMNGDYFDIYEKK